MRNGVLTQRKSNFEKIRNIFLGLNNSLVETSAQ